MAVTVANPPPAGPPVDPALLLRPSLVAGWLGVTTRTLANWAAAGKVPFHRSKHGHLRFVAAELVPAVAAMGRVVPPLPASIAQPHPQAMPAVADPPDSPAIEAEPDQAGDEDGPPAGQERTGQTPIASVELGRFLVKQRFYGACDQATAELFFDEGRESGYLVRQRHQAAKAICALCPILWECRLVGRADPTLVGIWGGETQDERRLARHTPPIRACRQKRTRRAAAWPAWRPSSPDATVWTPPPERSGSRPPRCAACSTSTASASRRAPPIQAQRRREVNPYGHPRAGRQPRPRPVATGAAGRGPARRPGLGDHPARPP